MFQVLYERGFIDTNEHAKYNVKAVTAEVKDAMTAAELVEYKKFNMRIILGGCSDFNDELAQIAYMLKEIGGATVTFTPICHPELAGEGIEYIWGKSKRSFRKQRSGMDMNKITQDEFVQLVDRSLLEVTKKSALAFARKARYFKLAYRVLSDKKAAVLDRAGAAGPPKLTSSYMEIEEAVKHIKNTTYQCHRGVSEVLVDGEE